ncbi:MAG: response regulator [Chitinivibrionales bacterium]|nr:response regulator [Chitinivibrionales bacterium]
MTPHRSCSARLYNSIRLLIVDDDLVIRENMAELFSSPLFSIAAASSMEEASSLIQESEKPWHCWIIDIALQGSNDGLVLIEKYPHFPYKLVLSGLGSMHIATQALAKGALKAFDKTPHSLTILYNEVCRISALSFLLRGVYTKHYPYFTVLMHHLFQTTQQWAEAACLCSRQLERICTLSTGMRARYVMSFYYVLYRMLAGDAGYDDSSSTNPVYHMHHRFCLKNQNLLTSLLNPMP